MINRKGEGSPYGSFTFFYALSPIPSLIAPILTLTLTPTLTYPHTCLHP